MADNPDYRLAVIRGILAGQRETGAAKESGEATQKHPYPGHALDHWGMISMLAAHFALVSIFIFNFHNHFHIAATVWHIPQQTENLPECFRHDFLEKNAENLIWNDRTQEKRFCGATWLIVFQEVLAA